jgi:hypothetical protein
MRKEQINAYSSLSDYGSDPTGFIQGHQRSTCTGTPAALVKAPCRCPVQGICTDQPAWRTCCYNIAA